MPTLLSLAVLPEIMLFVEESRSMPKIALPVTMLPDILLPLEE